jgi:hypothetical protein
MFLLLAGFPPILSAQNPDDAALIRRLLDRVEQLEKRVAELEAKSVPAAATPAAKPGEPAVEPAPDPEELAQAVHSEHIGETKGNYVTPSLVMRGFTDINFGATDRPGAVSGFSEGQFVLHIASALSERVSYFGEVSFTARNDAGLGTPRATGFDAEIERSIIRYDQSDYFKISFGRYHTPINYWNNAYHHGQWLQTTISRPEMTQFGGSFIPVHFIGGLAEGTLPANGLNFTYNAGIGNGRSSVLSRGGDFGDINNNRAWLATAFIKPDSLDGLQVGGSYYQDRISLARFGPVSFDETITSAHLMWLGRGPEVIAEIANARHRPAGSDAAPANSLAWYVQGAYRLPIAQRAWKPYYRYEHTRVPRADLVFYDAVLGLSGSTLGLRYDFSPFAALKFEYRSVSRPGVPRFNGGFVQTSFTF